MPITSDANILIDLAKLELIEIFSRLSFDLHTTDFIVEELNEEQLIPVNQLIKSGKLTVIETEEIQDFQAITDLLSTSNGLSFEDCSVWYYSKKLSGALLTGDGKLRKQASRDVEVRGIIFIFDELLKQNLLTFSVAIEKITILYQLNNRLPKKILDDRLQIWREEKHVG